MNWLHRVLTGMLSGMIFLAAGWVANASMVVFAEPTFDRWMYPFNATPGTRANAPTFRALGSPGFDERDATFYVGYDTSTLVPLGLGPALYQVNSVTLKATVSLAGFQYDPSYDSYRSYLPVTNALYQADSDAGRAVELYGAGYAAGQSFTTFGETGPFGAAGARTVFPTSDVGAGFVDVSNNIGFLSGGINGFESNPFAVGTSSYQPGEVVAPGTEFTFQLNLSGQGVLEFIQQGLHRGDLGFVLSSMHAASFGGAANYPQWSSKENVIYGGATLMMDVTVIPEPDTAMLVVGGVVLLRVVRARTLWRIQ